MSVAVLRGEGSASFTDDFPLGTSPSAAASADLDGDGDADVVIAVAIAGSVQVYENRFVPEGRVRFVADLIAYDVGENPVDIALGDLNNDGRLDVVTPIDTSTGGITVLLGQGGLAFGSPIVLPGRPNPKRVRIGHVWRTNPLDPSGIYPDILTAQSYDNQVGVYYNQTTVPGAVPNLSDFQRYNVCAPFCPLPPNHQHGPIDLVVADVVSDGLGALDVAVANRNSGTVSILEQKENRELSVKQMIPVAALLAGITAGSFNPNGTIDPGENLPGDATIDLAVTSQATDAVYVISLLPNQYPGYEIQPFMAGDAPGRIEAANLDEADPTSTFLDLAVVNEGSNEVSFLRGLGSRRLLFDQPINARTGVAPKSLSLSRVDSPPTGSLDLVIANQGGSSVSVLRDFRAQMYPRKMSEANLPSAPTMLAYDVVAGDFDASEPCLDLAVVGTRDIGNTRVLHILSGNGSGDFVDTGSVEHTVGPSRPAVLVSGNFLSPQSGLLPPAPESRRQIAVAEAQRDRVIVFDTNLGIPSQLQVIELRDHSTPALGPTSLAVGSLNSGVDSYHDIAVACALTDSLVTLLSDPKTPGHFSISGPFPTGGAQPRGVALADFDGDADLDAAVCHSGLLQSADTVTYLSGTGLGTFGTATTVASLPFDSDPGSLAIGDVNADGKLDVVLANLRAGTVVTLLNTGTPGGPPVFGTILTTSAGPTPHRIQLADVDENGKLDVVVLNVLGSNERLVTNDLFGINAVVGENPVRSSFDGRYIAYAKSAFDPAVTTKTRDDLRHQVFLFDLATGTESQMTFPQTTPDVLGEASDPYFQPWIALPSGTSWLYFSQEKNGVRQIFRRIYP